MSRIKCSNTRPEQAVRSALHRLGYRFRLETGKRLPGKPDVVLPSRGIAIFVNGCFWHRHPSCRLAYNPKTRPQFWKKKFAQNVERDQQAIRNLQAGGWCVLTVWECQTKHMHDLVKQLEGQLTECSHSIPLRRMS